MMGTEEHAHGHRSVTERGSTQARHVYRHRHRGGTRWGTMRATARPWRVHEYGHGKVTSRWMEGARRASFTATRKALKGS